MLDLIITTSMVVGITAASTIGLTLFFIAMGKIDV